MIVIGSWLFDPPSRRLLAGNEVRRLTPKAADVLEALAESPRHVWTRNALLERVWPRVLVGEEVLTHAIAELRRALGDDFRAPAYLETVHKKGYRLLCHVDAPGEADGSAALPIDLDRYASFVEACELFERGGSANTARAAQLFRALAEAEPDYAPAHIGTAKALACLNIYYNPRVVALDEALRHCSAARRRNPGAGEVYAAEGFIQSIGADRNRAMQKFGIAMRLAPDSSEVHSLLGRACFAQLDMKLAAPMLERAAALRGEEYHSLMLAGKARHMKGEVDRARANFVRAATRIKARLEADPGDLRALLGLGCCLVYLGQCDEAFSILERARNLDEPDNYHLACTLARAGERRRALDMLEAVVDQGWNRSAGLGQGQWVDAGMRDWNRRAWLEHDPDFAAIRLDRRFQRLVRATASM